MRIVIALSLDQIRHSTAAAFADHVVLVEGGKKPTGGFGRPPANPTHGYARLHWVGERARFEGLSVSLATSDLDPDPSRILLYDRDDRVNRAQIDRAVAALDLQELPICAEVKRGGGEGWSLASPPRSLAAAPARPSPPSSATGGEEVTDDVGVNDKPDDPPKKVRQTRSRRSSRAKPVPPPTAPSSESDGVQGAGGDEQHGAGDPVGDGGGD